MKRSITFAILFLVITIAGYAQDKKVAVVSFYADKQIGSASIGSKALAAELDRITSDTKFDAVPLLNNFHDQFFENFTKDFPFQFLPEDEVIDNKDYKAFTPDEGGVDAVLKSGNNLPYHGYKIIPPLKGHENELNMLQMFAQCDGIMKVYVSFSLEQKGFGGMALIKIGAHANIEVFNKKGSKVFSIKKEALSKTSGALIAGLPSLTSATMLSLCESAMDELIISLQGELPKLAKKADRRL